MLFGLFRLSVSMQVLLLALLGSFASTAGWRIADRILLNEVSAQQPQVRVFVDQVTTWPGSTPQTNTITLDTAPSALTEPASTIDPRFGRRHRGTTDRGFIDGRAPMLQLPDLSIVAAVFQRTPAYVLTEPFRRLFVQEIGWDQCLFYSVGGFWTLLVWCLFGGAITRITALRLGRQERVGLRDALAFARQKWCSYFAAPVLPLLAIIFLGLPLMAIGIVMRLDIGVAIAGLLWIIVGLTGLGMAIFAIGLLFGWPLMWSTVSTEGTDAFDAISRSYAYTYQRPLQYLLYVALATTLGVAGWFLVAFFCDTMIGLTSWAIAWGAGASTLESVRTVLADSDSQSGRFFLPFGANLIGLFTNCIRSFVTAYSYGFFWVAAAGIYLLLRHDTDQTPIDDVYMTEDDELSLGLPNLAVDEAGVPGVAPADEVTADEAKAARPEP